VVNDGQKEFCDLTECLVRESTIAVTGGTQEYDLNSTANIPNGDYSRIAAQGPTFIYVDASSNTTILSGDDFERRDIPWLDRHEPGWRESSVTSSVQQLPTYWYLRPDGARMMFGMVPTPCTGSSATATVRVPYVLYPDAMTSDTQQPFNVSSSPRLDLRAYHQALSHYGAYQLEKLRRDTASSAGQLQLFMGYVTRYLSSMRKKGKKTISYARRYFRRSDASDEGVDPRV
jgi:hypothetical protein